MSILPKKLDERFRRFYFEHASLKKLEELTRLTIKGKKLPHPKFIFIEPTNICNYKCPKCPQAEGLGRPPASMDMDLFREIIGQLKPHKPTVTLHHSGEPMLHPKIFEMIGFSRKAGLETVIVTNASLLDKEDFRIAKEGPGALVMSVDGAGPGSYETAHGGAPWEKIKSNIEEFFKRLDPAGPTTHVLISMVQVSQKPEEIQEYIEFTKRFSFYSVLVKPAFLWPDGKRKIPILEFPAGHHVYQCGHPWLNPAILADGSVVPCCLDANCLYPAGNVKEKPFFEIFTGEKMNQLRSYVLDPSGKPPVPLCDSCGIKRMSIPISIRGRILFKTLPYWKYLFRKLTTPIEV